MDIQTVLLAVVPVLVSVAIAWGVIRSEVSAMKERMNKQDELMEKMVNKDSCGMRHQFTDQAIKRIEDNVEKIGDNVEKVRELLTRVLDQHSK